MGLKDYNKFYTSRQEEATSPLIKRLVNAFYSF